MAYLGDIIGYGRNWDEHPLQLHQVLTCIQQAALKLKSTKYDLAHPLMEFLGHKLSIDGITPCPTKLQALTNMVPPSNITQVRTFVGLASYYSRFVPQFEWIGHGLHQLTKKGGEFWWT